MAKNAKKNGIEELPIPIKKPVSNKQPSLFPQRIKFKKAKRTLRVQERNADLFLFVSSPIPVSASILINRIKIHLLQLLTHVIAKKL